MIGVRTEHPAGLVATSDPNSDTIVLRGRSLRGEHRVAVLEIEKDVLAAIVDTHCREVKS